MDVTQLDEDSIKVIDKQAEENIMYDYLQCPVCGKKHHSNAKMCECGCNLISNPKLNIKEVAEIYNNLDNIKINERDKKVYITYHKKIKQLIDEIDYLLDEKTI